jgi:hypothetical protein
VAEKTFDVTGKLMIGEYGGFSTRQSPPRIMKESELLDMLASAIRGREMYEEVIENIRELLK